MRQTRQTRQRRPGERGQAIAEILAGLVGMAILFAAMLQICRLGEANIVGYLEARRDADYNAYVENLIDMDSQYVGAWHAGADGLRFTTDDATFYLAGDGIAIFADELNDAPPSEAVPTPLGVDELQDMGAFDGMSGLLGSNSLGVATVLYEGHDERSEELEAVLQTLIYFGDAPTDITLKNDSYMPALNIPLGGDPEGS